MTTRTAIRTCPLCEATCGLVLTMAGDRVLRTAGDEDDVFSEGFMCPKGATLGELHHDPDWHRRPLIRHRGRLVQASWDEAFELAGHLVRAVVERSGPTAMAVYFGNPISHNLGGLLYAPTYLKALASPRLFTASSLDQRPKDLVNALLYGDRFTLAVPDLDRTDFLVVVGANPVESNGSLATAPGWPRRLRAIRERGGRLVVVDPVRTRTAELADEHVRPRVASDAALLASMVNVLFDEGLVRLGRLGEFVTGVESVRRALADLTPERVADYTGVPARSVRDLTRRFAAAERACVYGRIGTTATEFGTLTSWLVDLLNILTGNLDREGGAMFPLPACGSPNTRGRPGFGPPPRLDRFSSRVRGLPERFGELPTSCLAEEIDTPGDGQLRGLLLISGNPVVSAPNSERTARALASLDALVAVDPYVNDSTRFAHVVLPPPGPLQRSHYDVHFTTWAVRNVANYSPAVLDLDPGQLEEWQIMCRLAAAFEGRGASEADVDRRHAEMTARAAVSGDRTVEDLLAAVAPRVGPERLLDLMIRSGPYGDAFGDRPGGLTLATLEERPHGVDLGPLRPRLPEVLRTPTGTVALDPPLIVDDLPRLRAAIASAPREGLVLIGRRHVRSNNSWMGNVPSLMTGRPRATLWLNPADAERLGVTTGDVVAVATRVSTVHAPAEVTERVPAGVVSLPHGWLHEPDGVRLATARARPGVNSNRLADELVLDVPSGNAVLNGIPVQVTAPRADEHEQPINPLTLM